MRRALAGLLQLAVACTPTSRPKPDPGPAPVPAAELPPLAADAPPVTATLLSRQIRNPPLRFIDVRRYSFGAWKDIDGIKEWEVTALKVNDGCHRSYPATPRLSSSARWTTIVPVRALHCLAVLGALLACRTGSVDTSSPGPPAPEPSPLDSAMRSVVADRGVVHGTRDVNVKTLWRSDVTPRGVILLVPAADVRPDVLDDLSQRTLDANFNVALVSPASEPLAERIDVAAGLANDKSLGARQWYERGDPRQPTLTVLWLVTPDAAEALAALRDRPPFMVAAAIVTTRGGAPQRSDLPGDPGPLRALELPVPRGLDDAAWSEALRFIADVERDVLGR